jgi:hypothetical protein
MLYPPQPLAAHQQEVGLPAAGGGHGGGGGCAMGTGESDDMLALLALVICGHWLLSVSSPKGPYPKLCRRQWGSGGGRQKRDGIMLRRVRGMHRAQESPAHAAVSTHEEVLLWRRFVRASRSPSSASLR